VSGGDAGGQRIVWFLHGILGQGRNWRSFARRVVDTWPSFRAVLPDLRCHGDAPPSSPPHDLAACAADLARLARTDGEPDVVVGHSFGGKVALVWLRDHARGDPVTFALDSPPGAGRPVATGPTDPARIVELLRSIPTPTADRDPLRHALRAGGLPEPIVQWLLTSARRDADGWRWSIDLDGVRELLASYVATDLWPFLATTPREVHLVRAGRSDRWSPADLARPLGPRVTWDVVPEAGHWLHVDDPEGTLALLAPTFAGR
jgi:esterase